MHRDTYRLFAVALCAAVMFVFTSDALVKAAWGSVNAAEIDSPALTSSDRSISAGDSSSAEWVASLQMADPHRPALGAATPILSSNFQADERRTRHLVTMTTAESARRPTFHAMVFQEPFPGPFAVALLSLGGFVLTVLGIYIRDKYERRRQIRATT